MWGRLTVLCALMCVTLSAPFPATLCPDSCICTSIHPEQLEAQCKSYDFLEKLQPKQVNAIVSLNLSNNNITKIHNKLKKLKNLKSVNLSYNNINDITELSFLPKLTNVNLASNHIKYFTAASLPKHLVHLDVSYNYLNHIPQLFKQLSSLKEINLYENPISCNCDVLKERDFLLNAGIRLLEPVACHSPENQKGHILQKAHCAKFDHNHFDGMQGDEPAIEGSGDEVDEMQTSTDKYYEKDIFDDNVNDTEVLSIADDQLIPESHDKFIDNTSNDNDDVEGSGDIFSPSTTAAPEDDVYDDYDEGSGSDENVTLPPIDVTHDLLPACNFDCSTPLPIDVNNTDNDTNNPDVLREIKIVLGILPENEEKSTTEEPNKEETIARTTINKETLSRSNGNKEKIQQAVNSADANEISEQDKSSMNTNIIIVIGLIGIMICLVGYSILKKRKSRRSPAINEQEMKPLNVKPTNGSSNIPEKKPLMNGQNGNMNGKPVEEPVAPRRNEELDSSALPEEEVVLRKKKRDEESLLPETHRVTIQVKELSTPKTPLLVNRMRNDDGNIITTPSRLDEHL